MSANDAAIAVRLNDPLDSDGFPSSSAWESVSPVRFNTDWQGKNADLLRETEVRLLWTPQNLFLRFRCRFRNITVFPDSDPSGRRDHLWDRDVAEVFLQPDPSHPRRYFEFEISPNGFWIDLDIHPNEKLEPHSGLRRRVHRHDAEKIWLAELAIPISSMIPSFDPGSFWRVNFFRVEGPTEPRFYSSWRPTRTPEPNFHVPSAFAPLVFSR
jgi:alpha-galactosidase